MQSLRLFPGVFFMIQRIMLRSLSLPAPIKRMDIIIIKCNGNSAFCLGYVKISSLRRLYVVIIVYPFIGQDLFTEDKFYFYGVLIALADHIGYGWL